MCLSQHFGNFNLWRKILLTFSGICAINFVLILRQYTYINRQAISISQKAKWKIKRLSSINIHCYYNILRDGQQFVLSTQTHTPTTTPTQTPQSKVYWHLSLYSNINWTRGQKGGTTTDRGLAKAALQSKARKSTIKCK